MKGREWALWGLVIVGLVAVCVFAALYGVTAQRQQAARAKIEVPPAVAEYEALQEQHRASTENNVDTRSTTPSALRDKRSHMEVLDDLFHRAAFANNDPKFGEMLQVVSKWPSRSLFPDSSDVGEWTPDIRDTLFELVAMVQPLLDEVRAAAVEGGPVHALDFSKGFAMELPHLAPMRNLARLLKADALVASEQGNTDRTVDDIVAMAQLGNALAGEPILISQLHRIAIVAMACSTLNLLPDQGLERADYDRLMAVFDGAGHRAEFAANFGGEALMIERFFDDLHGDPFGGAVPDDIFQAAGLRVYTSPLGRPMVNMDEASVLGILQRVQEATALPLYEAEPRLEAIEADVEELPWWQPLSRVLLPSITRAGRAQARHEATLAVAQLGLTIEQFHNDTETYPVTLDEIAGQISGDVSIDPFTGNPYIYRITEDGFIVYSVGENGVDDGGRHDPQEGDIVWRGVSDEE